MNKGKTTVKHTILLSCFILILGCGLKRPSQEDLKSADYGTYPFKYEEIVKSHMSKRLFDPYSAVYEFQGLPTQGWQNYFGKIYYGFRGFVYINAKNRMGGYVGSKLFVYLIKNGQVIFMEHSDQE